MPIFYVAPMVLTWILIFASYYIHKNVVNLGMTWGALSSAVCVSFVPFFNIVACLVILVFLCVTGFDADIPTDKGGL